LRSGCKQISKELGMQWTCRWTHLHPPEALPPLLDFSLEQHLH
jgi:hypothetical protein